MENFSSHNGKNNKNKFNFKQKKDCCVKSLKEINSFLCNVKKAKIALCLYKWFK